VWNGRGLKPDGTDDLCKLPVTFDPNNDFTMYIVADVGTAIPGAYQTVWSAGMSASATEHLRVMKKITSGDLEFSFAVDPSSYPSTIPNANIMPGLRAYRLKRKEGKISIADMHGFSATPSNSIVGTFTPDLQTLFATGMSTYSFYSPAEVLHIEQYAFATTPQQDKAIADRIKKQMKAERGVDVGKKYSVISPAINGNFVDTSGWGVSNSTFSVDNNTLSLIGNGGGASPYALVTTPSAVSNGKKVYVKALATVTNELCTSIDINMVGSTGGILTSASITPTPTQNHQYTISGILVTPADFTGTYRIRIYEKYADAITANGKVMEVQKVMYCVLTDDFANGVVGTNLEPSKEWCDANIGVTWFEGVKVLN